MTDTERGADRGGGEAGRVRGRGVGFEEEPPTYSKDYWDNVFEQVGRRPFVKVALAVLALLYGTAIFAPLLANDRPYRLHGIDYKGYGRALKTIYASSLSLRGLAQKDRATYSADLERTTAFRRYSTAVRVESQGLLATSGEVRELVVARRDAAVERALKLRSELRRPELEFATEAATLREWLDGRALAALREFERVRARAGAVAGPLTGDEARLLADLRSEVAREAERLESRARILDRVLAPSAGGEPPFERIAAQAGRAASELLAADEGSALDTGADAEGETGANGDRRQPGDRDAARAATREALELVADVRDRIGSALVVSKLPEAGRKLLREFVEHAEALDHLARLDREAYLEEQARAGLFRPFEDALREERKALAGLTGTVRAHLPPEPATYREQVAALEKQADAVVAAILADRGAQARVLADALRDAAKELRTSLAAREPGAADDAQGVELVATTRYPLWESISSIEIFCMVLWAFVLAWPLWNAALNRLLLRRDPERIRGWRRKKSAAVLGVSLALAIVWKVAVGGALVFDSAGYKEGLSAGDIAIADAQRDVRFPPLAMGYAENHSDERYRPPTWHATSEIDEQGYYVRGPQAPEPDPFSGALPPPRPVEVRFGEPERNAATRHVLGTDSVGRDIFTRILHGGRISLAVGILSTALLLVIGVVMGALAGYFGGRVDMAISRLIEVVQAFPAFFLILTAVALIPEDKVHPIFAIVFFIAIVRWTGVARLVRGEFLRLREADFAMAARALGFSPARVIFRHVLPNAMGPVLVAAAFSVAAGILTESGISFLGLGIKEPIPSWGSVLNDSRAAEHWWIQVFPGLLIFVTVFCYNVVGEGIRDALDPRRKV